MGSDRQRQVGDKLGPRIAAVIAQAVIATRRGLAPHEARVRQAATQALIDAMGREAAALWRPITDRIRADKADTMHPLIAAHLDRFSSGQHQWESLLGHLQMSAAGPIGQVMGNLVAPVAYEINHLDRSLIPDPGIFAQAVASGLISYGTGDEGASFNGLTPGGFRLLADLAVTVPDSGTLTGLFQRGLISREEFYQWLRRAGLPDAVTGPVIDLAAQILTPADAALAVLRGTIDLADGQRIARLNGMAAADFAIVVDNTGEPLGLEQLLEAYRRGFITKDRLARGIAQSRVRDEWIDVAEDLRYSPVPTADAIDAYQRGRLDHDTAVAIATANGTEPGQVQILIDNAGNPPAPEQLLELWRRGKIGEAQVDAGLLQGRTKDSWIGQVKDLLYEPITSADAVDAWLRGHLTEAETREIVIQNGTEPGQVHALLDNAGNPPAPEQLLELLREKKITLEQAKTGLEAGRTRNEWIGQVLDLTYRPMTSADALTAAVQGQISEAAAREIVTMNGIRDEDFQALYNSAGEPLSRTELEQLYNRGLITEAVVLQGLRESRLKDKYVQDALQLHVRLLAPEEITRALGEGAITSATALAKLRQHGYSEQDAVILVTEATLRATGQYRQLLLGQVSALYGDRIVDHATAETMLTQLHYSPAVAGLVLQLADYTRDQKIQSGGITTIKTHYVKGRLSEVAARADLHVLGVPAQAVDLYIKTWQTEMIPPVRLLSEAQVVKAVKNHLFVAQGELSQAAWDAGNHDAGHAYLVQLGYTPADADLLLAGA